MGLPVAGQYSVEDAIELIGSGKIQAYVVVASGLGLMALLLDTMGVSMTIPASTCELELDTFRKGVLNCVSFLGIALTAHLWGFLADTIGRNKSIRYSLIGSILLTGAAAFVPNFWALIVLRLLSGMSLSGASSALYAYMGEMMSNKVRTRLMVFFGSFIGVTVIIMCGVGWLINSTQPMIHFSEGYTLTPWRIQWLIFLIPGIIAIFLYHSLPESPLFLVSIGDTKGAHSALKEIYTRNGNVKEFPVTSIAQKDGGEGHSGKAHKGNILGIFRSMARETMILLRPPYLGPVVCCCLVQYAIYTVASGIGMWYPEITNRLSFDGNSTGGGFCEIFTAKKEALVDLTATCNVQVTDKMFVDNMILGVGYLLSNTIIFVLQTKMILRHIVILFLTVSCICGFLLPSFSSEVAVLACFTVFLMSTGSCVTTINIVTVGLFPTFLRGMTLSVTLVLGRIAIVIGVNVMGFLLESYCQWTIYGVAALVAVAALFTMFIMPKKAIS